MSFRIRTLEEYNAAYKQSVDAPDMYWGNVAEEFT